MCVFNNSYAFAFFFFVLDSGLANANYQVDVEMHLIFWSDYPSINHGIMKYMYLFGNLSLGNIFVNEKINSPFELPLV